MISTRVHWVQTPILKILTLVLGVLNSIMAKNYLLTSFWWCFWKIIAKFDFQMYSELLLKTIFLENVFGLSISEIFQVFIISSPTLSHFLPWASLYPWKTIFFYKIYFLVRTIFNEVQYFMFTSRKCFL